MEVNYMFKLVSIVSLIAVCLVPRASRAVKIAQQAVGQVLLQEDAQDRIGTAFVAGEKHHCYMPGHVAVRDTLWYKPHGDSISRAMRVLVRIVELDMAIYGFIGAKAPTSIPIGEFHKCVPGDSVRYAGYPADDSLIFLGARIRSTGKTEYQGEAVDYLDFFGKCGPECSGGPVVNEAGEVVAIIFQAYDITTLREPPITARINRALSLGLFRVFDKVLKE